MARPVSRATAVPSADKLIPEEKIEAYNQVVGAAKLIAVQVSKIRFDVEPEFFDKKIKRSLSIDHTELGSVFNRDESAVYGRFRFDIYAKRGNKRLLFSSAEYVVFYDLTAIEADDQAAVAFCNRVGLFAAYPYCRALVAHLSWDSNTNLPIMPVIATRGSPIRAARSREKDTKDAHKDE